MKKLVLVAALGASLLPVGRVALSDEAKKECCDAEREVKVPGFAKLKALAGEWKANLGEGHEARVSWALTAAGTALMETHKMGEKGSMVTLYHADGDTLALTHYCALGNQPRMKASKVTDSEIVFELAGGTNIDKEGPYMGALTIAFRGADKVTETWTLKTPKGDQKKVFEWERVK